MQERYQRFRELKQFLLKFVAMSKKSRNPEHGIDLGVDIVSGAAAAMMYTEEEIRDIFSPEDAEEFLELRREVVRNYSSQKYDITTPDCGDTQSQMAAEDEEKY